MNKMAYIIQCHKNANQVNRLINKLDDGNTDFFIHIDLKSDIKKDIMNKENVHFTPDCLAIQWGGFSQVEATIKLFKEVKKYGVYSYIHLISGQDFPIKTNEEIQRYFSENKGNQFIEYVNIPPQHMSRISVYYPSIFTGRGNLNILRLIYKKIIIKTKIFTRNISFLPELYYGSSWFSITGECMEYILEFIDNETEFYNFFKNTLCGDEVFFQTILINSPYKDKIINNNLRYIEWNKGAKSPNTLKIDDFNKLIDSEKMFARKFDAGIDNKVIEKLEKKLSYKK